MPELDFKDYFSSHSVDYARYRPDYPPELFSYLASLSPSQDLAWDCATGNGQTACGLATKFTKVIATDPSAAQLTSAVPRPNIEYLVASAEQSGIQSESVDLITVSQALHWFRLSEFYREAKQVLKPAGILAVWCYHGLEIAGDIQTLLRRFYSEVAGPYWPPERRLVEEHYQTIPFPFEEIEPPPFYMRVNWSAADLFGYVQTWSATQRLIAARGREPVEEFGRRMLDAWGGPPDQIVPARWRIHMRVGSRP